MSTDSVKQWINEHREEMESQGLTFVYMNQTDIFPAVILTLNSFYICDELYWRITRECIRKCGAEYVSNIYDNNLDIDEDYKLYF